MTKLVCRVERLILVCEDHLCLASSYSLEQEIKSYNKIKIIT